MCLKLGRKNIEERKFEIKNCRKVIVLKNTSVDPMGFSHLRLNPGFPYIIVLLE